ncbi:MAG: rhodanese-like domain-containing protein [Treponema sp.]|nr:rhodanese-like domain-containing protein [Treponema sp.]
MKNPKNISAKDAKAVMDSGQPYTLVDVRTRDEFEEKRIKGAINIPVDEVESAAESKLRDKNAVILVYCLSGGRSSRACKLLANMGYTNVSNFGGIMSWPYDTISG